MQRYPKISIHAACKDKLEQLKVVFRDVGYVQKISIAETVNLMCDSAISTLKKGGKWPYNP